LAESHRATAVDRLLVAVSLALLSGLPARALAAPGSDPRPAPPSRDEAGAPKGDPGAAAKLEELLPLLGEKAQVYESVALKFICIESVHSGDTPNEEKRFDYMYIDAQEQRYVPYRQRHTGKPERGVQETALAFDFPDAYSWTLMFLPRRQHLFHFKYVGQEWFSLRLAHILEFTAPLPFTSGRTIYEWSGRVWIDAENYNFLKVEAEPGNQEDRLNQDLKSYRQAPRFLVFPMAKRPRGSTYNVTFLNEYQKLSLPDQTEYRYFGLDLDGSRELEGLTILRYTGYRFYDVNVKDKFLK